MGQRKGRIAILSVAVASLLSFAACSSMEVNTAKAPNADFNQYKTYAWVAPPPPGSGAPLSSILDQTVKSTVETQLMSKGLSAAVDSPPDLLISYSSNIRNEIEYGAAPQPWSWGWNERYIYPVREGSIHFVFTDAKTNHPVWQGTAADEIGKTGPNQKDVTEAVTQLMQKYPSA